MLFRFSHPAVLPLLPFLPFRWGGAGITTNTLPKTTRAELSYPTIKTAGLAGTAERQGQ
jgi:hypothetical protein